MTAVPDSASPAERYLRDWHRRHPDASRVFVTARDETGRSSYQRLASFAADAAATLDLACGTGTLLSLVHELAPSARLFGIELSESELRIAAERLPTSQLCLARAQALPLATGSVDLVLCHMALMLMDRPEDVLGEVRRILQAGGRFSAITNQPTELDAVAKTILGALRATWTPEDNSEHPPRLGDPRTYHADALRSLLTPHFTEVFVESFCVVQYVPHRDLWPYLVDSIYGLDAIDEADGRAILAELSLPDPLPWTVSMVQVQAST